MDIALSFCPPRSSGERGNNGLGDNLHRPARDLARLAEPREGLILRQAFLLHEQSLRPFDRLARGEGGGQRLCLLAELDELEVASAGGMDRRKEVGLAE